MLDKELLLKAASLCAQAAQELKESAANPLSGMEMSTQVSGMAVHPTYSNIKSAGLLEIGEPSMMQDTSNSSRDPFDDFINS